jgi:hypothetical protein
MKYLFSVLVFFSARLHAQEDSLLRLLDQAPPKTEKVTRAFHYTRVIMSHSVEMLPAGVLDFRILHRFGNVDRGLYEFFGLDQATIRLGLDYGITNNVMVGIGRGSYKKELDAFVKYRALQQQRGARTVPVSVLAAGGITLNTLRFADPARKNYFSSRLAYYGQLIVGRKFNERFSLQVMPSMLHRNLVATADDPNDIFAAGIGGRMKLSKRFSLNVDYHYVINQNEALALHNPLSVGFDIETGGHVFQLHVTNAAGMNERVFLTETVNDWAKGQLQFGFNISRVFQVRKKDRGSKD